MDPISAGIIFLVFVVLIVFSVLAAKTWHWSNIVFINLTFLAAVAASIGLAQAYQLRHRDIKLLNDNRALAEKTRLEAERAISGPPDSATYTPDSLRYKAQQVQLTFMSRGRVWSNGQVTADGDKRKIKLAVARTAEEVADENGKLKGIELHLFADATILEQPYPVSYIGRVVVADETAEELTITPVLAGNQPIIVDSEQWTNPSTTWSLFEQMPLDRHDIFLNSIRASLEFKKDEATEEQKNLLKAIEDDETQPDPTIRQLQIGTYRQILENQFLTAESLKLNPGKPEDAAKYEAIIDKYAFDGFTLGQIDKWLEQNAANRISKAFVPPDEEVFVVFKFKKPSAESYEVNSDTGTIQNEGAFTSGGKAVDKMMHSDGPIRFEEGAMVLVDKLTADGQLGNQPITPFAVKEKDAEEIAKIYRRKLRNFPFLFSNHKVRSDEIDGEIRRLQKGMEIEKTSLANAERQRDERDRLLDVLKKDLENLNRDQVDSLALLNERQAQIDSLTSELEGIKQKIRNSYRIIQQQHQAIEQAVYTGR